MVRGKPRSENDSASLVPAQAVLSLDLEALFRLTYRFDKLMALRLSKGRLSTGGPSSLQV